MSTLNLNVTTEPQSVATAIGRTDTIEVGGPVTRCEIQNRSNVATLFVREQVMPPTPGHRGRRVESGGIYHSLLGGDIRIWVWTDDVAGCACVFRDL